MDRAGAEPTDKWRVKSGECRFSGTGTCLTNWLRFLNDCAETDKLLNIWV